MNTVPAVCRCEIPKPVKVTDETFTGLFAETPVSSVTYLYCDNCAGIVARITSEPVPLTTQAT